MHALSSKFHVKQSLFQKLVVKPDQLIKRRGKLGLINVNVNLEQVKAWLEEKMGKDQKVSLILM